MAGPAVVSPWARHHGVLQDTLAAHREDTYFPLDLFVMRTNSARLAVWPRQVAMPGTSWTAQFGVWEHLVRTSVGIEDKHVPCRSLANALAAAEHHCGDWADIWRGQGL